MPHDFRDPIRRALERVINDTRTLTGGAVADYIPELAHADPSLLGIALVSNRGSVHEAGDTSTEFTIQSVSKPFVLALALQGRGLEDVMRHVGVEPSGEPFNAISLDAQTGKPLNPLINAGAIVTSALAAGSSQQQKSATIAQGLAAFAGRDLDVDEVVFESENHTGDRNRALAFLASSTGILPINAEAACEVYFRQCSTLVTARDVAVMSATLAGGGVNPITGDRVVSEAVARWTTAIMASCGMYDASGEWMLRVGLPAKSGVGGGVAALLPGQFGIGTFSPPLDGQGNSLRGIAMLQSLSAQYGLHTLSFRGDPLSPIASLSLEDDQTLVHLRGDLMFAGAEEVLVRLSAVAQARGALTLDFADVTRLGPAALALFRDAIAQSHEHGLTVVVRDPNRLFEPRTEH